MKLEQAGIDCLVRMNLLDLDWHEYRTSVIDLSDTIEGFSLVTVLWQTETGDEFTAVVKVPNNEAGFLSAHLVLFGSNVA